LEGVLLAVRALVGLVAGKAEIDRGVPILQAVNANILEVTRADR
jgi:hypothetical protein